MMKYAGTALLGLLLGSILGCLPLIILTWLYGFAQPTNDFRLIAPELAFIITGGLLGGIVGSVVGALRVGKLAGTYVTGLIIAVLTVFASTQGFPFPANLGGYFLSVGWLLLIGFLVAAVTHEKGWP